MLELQNITKSYISPDGSNETVILKGINLKISAGDALAIVGPSGSGKSTLLNLIGTLDKPNSGQYLFNGIDMLGMNEQEQAEFRNKKIGFVFQQHLLLPQCTVLENVMLPTLVSAQADPEDYARELLDFVGLSEHQSHLPAQLSGGEQQRVAVVRALINRPDIILADEPTGSLDQENSEKLGDLLVNLNLEKGVTLLVVTHSVQLADRMHSTYRLRNAQLVKD